MPRKAKLAEASKAIDVITPDDKKIFELGARNVNYFTNHYLKSPTSGTYWRNKAGDDVKFDSIRQKAWEIMFAAWKAAGSQEALILQGVNYIVQYDGDKNPVFFHNHGFIMQPWQFQAHHATQPEICIIGGMGVGKTVWEAISNLVLAATIPNYRGICLAPQGIQVKEVYLKAEEWLTSTPYAERWVTTMALRPLPHITIENSHVGKSTIEMYSIEDDHSKIRTLECDTMMIDQAEKFDDLDDVIRDAGSRLRGQVQGREKLGRLALVANAGDNPELWYRFDMGEYQPKYYLSLNPQTKENPALTQFDIENMKRRVAADGNEEDIDQWMGAQRPMGTGEHFSRKLVENATNKDLNAILEHKTIDVAFGDKYDTRYVHKKTDKLGLYHFEFPPENNLRNDYIVISDPGSGNPPDRNSPIIGVWDVTNFPSNKMRLVAFNWIFGNNSYWPWVLAYQSYVERYHAQGRNAFDATGVQKGFDELVFADMGLSAEGMDMSGPSKKMLSINSLKFFLAKGLIEWPYVAHLNNQLTNYRLPDNKLRQDLVMMCAMAASWARRLYYIDLNPEDDQYEGDEVYERNDRRLYDRNSVRSQVGQATGSVQEFGYGDKPLRYAR